MTGAEIRFFVFDSTNGALWAEEIARARGIPVDVVPAPPESHALCDLALAARAADSASLESAFRNEGVPFRPWLG